MSIIKVTSEMLARFEPLPKNWYPFEVVGVEGPKPNKKNTLELKVKVKVLEGEHAGKESMIWLYPVAYATPFIDLASAIEGTQISAGMEIDPDRWVGKQFWSEALEDIYDGKMSNKYETFRSISDGPAF